MQSQWWTREQIDEFQNYNLRKLIKHSYENVPFYNEQFKKLKLTPDDIKTKDDLYKLPILRKEEIRKNFPHKIVAKNVPKSDLILNSSSGSTGQPLKYYQTKSSHSMWHAAGIRGWYWMGYNLGDKYIKISQNPRNSFVKKTQDFLNRSLYLSCQQLTNNNFQHIVEEINRYRPKYIRLYPDMGLFLSSYIKNNNEKVYSPSAITTTGNILFESTRKRIEEVFNCDVFDSYSCEGSATAAECSTHECYHSSMEYSIAEIIHQGTEVNPGEKGRIITTDLHNYATPLIRYDTQDYVVKSKVKCSCGRNLTPIEKIEGRDSDILIAPNGKLLIVHNFTVYFEWFDSIEQFQIRQNTADEFNILLKVNSKFTHSIEQDIYKYWYEYIGGNIKLKIDLVDDIPFTVSGKRRFLIRNENIQLAF